ncbi:MAG: heme exporter protein CcmD [Gammaproteobacteria bacterium]
MADLEALDYGKYAVYVWSSFALTAFVLIANVVAARRRLRQRLERERRRIAAEETQ